MAKGKARAAKQPAAAPRGKANKQQGDGGGEGDGGDRDGGDFLSETHTIADSASDAASLSVLGDAEYFQGAWHCLLGYLGSCRLL